MKVRLLKLDGFTRMAELADAEDLKSSTRKGVRVRTPFRVLLVLFLLMKGSYV